MEACRMTESLCCLLLLRCWLHRMVEFGVQVMGGIYMSVDPIAGGGELFF
jgi:hypothetical protein